jgi:hypothetical protein
MARLTANNKRKLLAQQKRVQQELAALELEIDEKIAEWTAAEEEANELVEKRERFLKKNAKFLTPAQLNELNKF